jgi:L-alanine-DL-glutamate epimerase-like enolase superfamily enzyme
VHGVGLANVHLCMSMPNTTYYESLVVSNPVVREPLVGPDGLVLAPTRPGIGYEGAGLTPYG